jgi:DNA-binding IclR family transcriptional regulator
MAAPTRPNAAGNGIQVISRAGQILRALASEREGLSLSEIAARVELPRSTVHRIVTALETEGLSAAASANGRYRLGPEFIRLAGGHHAELRVEARPLLEGLSKQVNETVDLSILIGSRVSFIDQVAARHRLRAVSAIGNSFPAHCTANGKALLAAHTDEQLTKLLPTRLESLTPNTIGTRSALLEELARTRSDGVALDREEHTLGISAIGAAVHDRFGAVAAISIPVPTQRFAGNEEPLERALRSTCGEVNQLLAAHFR